MTKLYGAEQRIIPRIEHGKRPRTDFVVIHDMESDNLDGVENYFRTSSPDAVGAHIGVGVHGETRQWADLDALVYHAVGGNSQGIGIEMCGYANFSVSRWLGRKKQRIAVAKAVARICHRYELGLPTSGKNVVAHAGLPAGGHHDPGPAYLGTPMYHGRPWQAMMALARDYYREWYA